MNTFTEMKKFVTTLSGCVVFDYNGHSCGIDPLSLNKFDMWYGDKTTTLQTIDEVVNSKFFDGKSLIDIWDDITDLDF